MNACIRAIRYHLPEAVLSNDELAKHYEGWSAEKIAAKTGIRERRVAAADECASDLAVKAGEALFASGACRPEDVDLLLLCTQSPDYFLPTTACLVQQRLGLPTTCGALDYNLGCSGWVYGLGLAKGMIESGQARTVLLITAETYSKFIHPGDKSVRTLFGDAAAATLVQGVEGSSPAIGPFVYGTDGRGAKNLIVPTGGMRRAIERDAAPTQDDSGNQRTVNNLYMNGSEIFTFTLRSVPQCVASLQERAGVSLGDIDAFVFHQANEYMLTHLRKKLGIPPEKFVVAMDDCGNTVSSTIPIALARAAADGRIKEGDRLMLVGFGVGYSWAGALARWTAASVGMQH